MGIRFDREYRKATNGPVIFFSDTFSQGAFATEINSALLSGLSFYSYRHPADQMITFGSSEGLVEGIGTPGFVIGRFNPNMPPITIPYKGTRRVNAGSEYDMPRCSTTREEYISEVNKFISLAKETPGSKIVASRTLVENTHVDPSELFFDLSKRFPDAYVFCFSTPLTGCWIGASPELLIKCRNGELSTMALAGTRISGDTKDWDEKNIIEQSIVTDYILESLEQNGVEARVGARFTKPTGNLEHLCTPITASVKDMDAPRLQALIRSLSPTPAVCGFPKDFALHAISETEGFQRGCYGGYCGPYHSADDFTFNVVLRCASLAQDRICVYAGGGITDKSDPSSEWQETEAKIKGPFQKFSH